MLKTQICVTLPQCVNIFVYCPSEAMLGTKLRSFSVVIYDVRSHMCSQVAVIYSACIWLLVVAVSFPCLLYLSIYLSGLVTAVAVFRNPNTIPFCLAIDLFLNVLFSWLLVHLPSPFFLDVVRSC